MILKHFAHQIGSAITPIALKKTSGTLRLQSTLLHDKHGLQHRMVALVILRSVNEQVLDHKLMTEPVELAFRST